MGQRGGRAGIFAAALVATSLGAGRAEADPAPPRAAVEEVGARLPYDILVELPITAVLAAGWFTLWGLEGRIGPTSCHWCTPSAVDVTVRNAVRWSNTSGANDLSYLTGFALAPVAAVGLDMAVVASGRRLSWAREWLDDGLIMAEAIFVAMDTNEIVKLAVGRRRPFAYFAAAAKGAPQPVDNDLSFYSGHTTLAFSAAVSAGTVATMKKYRAAPLIWSAGLLLAAGTGYLRMAADKHWLTDVIGGAVLGSAAGFVVPYLHRPCSLGRPCVMGLSAGPAGGTGAVVGAHGVLP